jgi:hypothetical protein
MLFLPAVIDVDALQKQTWRLTGDRFTEIFLLNGCFCKFF